MFFYPVIMLNCNLLFSNIFIQALFQFDISKGSFLCSDFSLSNSKLVRNVRCFFLLFRKIVEQGFSSNCSHDRIQSVWYRFFVSEVLSESKVNKLKMWSKSFHLMRFYKHSLQWVCLVMKLTRYQNFLIPYQFKQFHFWANCWWKILQKMLGKSSFSENHLFPHLSTLSSANCVIIIIHLLVEVQKTILQYGWSEKDFDFLLLKCSVGRNRKYQFLRLLENWNLSLVVWMNLLG